MAERYIYKKKDRLSASFTRFSFGHLENGSSSATGFLSLGHNGYLLSFIQHLAAASFALENLHYCGTYVFALTV